MLKFLTLVDDVDIFLAYESNVVLSTRMSDLEWSSCFVSGSLIASSTELHESVIVE